MVSNVMFRLFHAESGFFWETVAVEELWPFDAEFFQNRDTVAFYLKLSFYWLISILFFRQKWKIGNPLDIRS